MTSRIRVSDADTTFLYHSCNTEHVDDTIVAIFSNVEAQQLTCIRRPSSDPPSGLLWLGGRHGVHVWEVEIPPQSCPSDDCQPPHHYTVRYDFQMVCHDFFLYPLFFLMMIQIYTMTSICPTTLTGGKDENVLSDWHHCHDCSSVISSNLIADFVQ